MQELKVASQPCQMDNEIIPLYKRLLQKLLRKQVCSRFVEECLREQAGLDELTEIMIRVDPDEKIRFPYSVTLRFA
jgi:hypothetical protein